MNNPLDMMNNAIQNQKTIKSTAPLESEHLGKWEMDPEKWLDRVFHELTGETLNPETGNWDRNPKLKKTMNEKGASEFIYEITSRVSIHMQMSDLKDEHILDIASRAAEVYADKLEDNWELWDIIPTKSNLESLSQRMYDMLFIMLRIAMNGGMKKHREKSKNPYANIPQQQ